MKLFFSKGACSLVVRIIINEMKLTSEYVAVNLKTKQTENGEDYLKINPKGSVPALLIDQENLLTENSIILQYLADKYEKTNLLPPITQFKRYRILEWLNFISTDLHKACGLLFNPNFTADARNNVIIPVLKTKLNFVNKHFEGKLFFIDDSFTLPDAYLFVVLSWLKPCQISLSEWPHLEKFYENLAKRPSVKQSLTEEGLG